MIEVKKFGYTAEGKEVLSYTLKDGKYCATVLSFGGILQSLIVPDRAGNPTDVVLGYNTVKEYEENGGYLGALIGRFGNRIQKGRLEIDGKEYSLFCNDRGNHLHGGKRGFNAKIWEADPEGEELVLSYTSPDGEENYPGTLRVRVSYSLTGGELKIRYRAVTEKKTAVNLTNHAYFNLSGEGDGGILDHELMLKSDFITPTDAGMIPTGGFRAVKDTPFDFNEGKPIGKEIGSPDPDLLKGNGYDHCYVLKKKQGEFAEYAKVFSPKTGISMTCFTDMPAVQFYSGNGLHQQGKSAYYGPRAGFCLETQAIPNNVNVPEYAELGSSYLSPDEVYSFAAAYRFGLI